MIRTTPARLLVVILLWMLLVTLITASLVYRYTPSRETSRPIRTRPSAGPHQLDHAL